MTEKISRRELLKTSMAAGASSVALRKLHGASQVAGVSTERAAIDFANGPVAGAADGEIVELTCNDGVYAPPRGKSFFKFGFDFPEPSVAFQGKLLHKH